MAFMTHPEHGANNVPEHEIPAHEANGWKVDTFDNWMANKAKKPGQFANVDTPMATIEENEEKDNEPPRKPGRKPKAR